MQRHTSVFASTLQGLNPLISISAALLAWVTLATPLQAAQTLLMSEPQLESLGVEFAPLEPERHIETAAYPSLLMVPPQQIEWMTVPMDGLVTRIFRTHGPVSQGEAIVELQAVELLQRQKAYLATLSELKVAQKEVKRARSLIRSGVVSEKQLLASESRATTLKQQAQQQEQDLNLMGMGTGALKKLKATHALQPAMLTIRAPHAGELYDLAVRNGLRLKANDPVAKLANLEVMVASVHVPVSLAQRLQVGQTARLQGSGLEGTLAYIHPQADRETQTVEVHVRFANEKRRLTPGALASLTFVKATGANLAYRVPQSALIEVAGQAVIFLKEASAKGAIRLQPVKVYPQANRQAVIQFSGDVPDGLATDPERWQVLMRGSAAMLSAWSAQTEGGE